MAENTLAQSQAQLAQAKAQLPLHSRISLSPK
jgi:hypothetical protein